MALRCFCESPGPFKATPDSFKPEGIPASYSPSIGSCRLVRVASLARSPSGSYAFKITEGNMDSRTQHEEEGGVDRPLDAVIIGAGVAEIGRAVQQECRDRSRMPSSA
eukprot:TRINITY_DN50718_c0_g1_i3.p4 TRINITY_DN50718_c0_g1~~TRINITY_DN50718_c0_g1_i3.p4  ORF type:complete len:108 (+),score=16.57 TRINITY_DN50718_c0_g1_i3:88-411(+)